MYWFSSRVLLMIAAAPFVLNMAGVSQLSAEGKNADCIQPYAKNPCYWQYEGKHVMLLGGNKWDAPFFIQDQKSVYDDLQKAGGNYLRYILKQRQDDSSQVTKLVRIFPFRKLSKGKYDLNQWSDD